MDNIEITDETLNQIRCKENLYREISIEDTKLSLNQKMIVCYDMIMLDGEFGFIQEIDLNNIHGYFKQMKKFSNVSINEAIEKFHYTEHFHRSEIQGKLLTLLKKITGKTYIDQNVLIYHFALEPENKENKSRVYFLLGKYGIIHILFFDPDHKINPVKL